jgi:hypothetical protein
MCLDPPRLLPARCSGAATDRCRSPACCRSPARCPHTLRSCPAALIFVTSTPGAFHQLFPPNFCLDDNII